MHASEHKYKGFEFYYFTNQSRTFWAASVELPGRGGVVHITRPFVEVRSAHYDAAAFVDLLFDTQLPSISSILNKVLSYLDDGFNENVCTHVCSAIREIAMRGDADNRLASRTHAFIDKILKSKATYREHILDLCDAVPSALRSIGIDSKHPIDHRTMQQLRVLWVQGLIRAIEYARLSPHKKVSSSGVRPHCALLDEVISRELTKSSASKHKISLSEIPARVMAEVSVAFSEGVAKYGSYSFRSTKVKATDYYDAARRHLDAWLEGEDVDPDSGLSHITKAIAGLIILRDAMLGGNVDDTRPPKSIDLPKIIKECEHLKAKIQDSCPRANT